MLSKIFNIDLFITLLNRTAMIAAGFLASILTARYLGADGRGRYFFVITLLMTLAQFCNFGLQSSNTYLITQKRELLPKLVANSLWVSCLVGAGFTCLMLMTFNLPKEAWFTLLLVPSNVFFLLGTNLLIGLNEIKTFNLFQLGSSLFVLFGTLIAGYFKLNVFGFIAVYTANWLVIALLLLIHLFACSSISFRFDSKIFIQGFGFAMRVYITTLLGLLVLKGNVFLLKYYVTDETLGYFSIASQINDVLAILPATIGMLLFPNLIRNTNSRWQKTRHSLFVVGLMMLGICLLTAVLIKPLISNAFGVHFAAAIPMLLWMLPGAFFLGLISIVSQYLAATGFPREVIYLWTFAFFVVISSSFLLIPKYAAIGAAVSLSITYTILFCLIFIFANKTQKKLAINQENTA